MEPIFFNNNIFSQKCQTKLKKLNERVIFKEKLLDAVKYVFNSEKFAHSAENKINNFNSCGKYLNIDYETGEILKANFCKMRICPVCNYIKSSINFYKIKNCVQYIKEKYKAEFIFISLTVENCSKEKLAETITHLLQSLNRLNNRKTFKRSVLGFIRGLEITYSKKRDDFHPHIHMIVAVPQDYFYANNKNYITIDKLREWWTESARLDYFVQVDIRKVDKSDNAISEVAKYSIKMAEILNACSDEKQIKATQTVYECTYGRRLIGTSGVFKEALKVLKISDMDSFELESLRQNHKTKIDLTWENGNYKELNRYEQ